MKYKRYNLLYLFVWQVCLKLSSDSNKNSEVINEIIELGYSHKSRVNLVLESVKSTFQTINVLIYVLTFFVFIFVGLLMATYISSIVSEKKRTIGVLRALGFSGRDCGKVYFLQSTITTVVVLIISLISRYFLMALANNLVGQRIGNSVEIFVVSFGDVLLIILFIVISSSVSTIFPLKKITKLDPINAIKH